MLSALECVEVIVFAFVLVLALNRYAYGPRVVSGTPHKAVPWPAEVHDREVLIASQPLYFAKCQSCNGRLHNSRAIGATWSTTSIMTPPHRCLVPGGLR